MTEYAYVNVVTRGDLSSLRWIVSPLRHFQTTDPNVLLCKVYYASLNFRDIMLATGKLSPDAIPGEFVTLEGIVFMYCCSRINLLIASLAMARLHASMPESMLLRRKYSPAAELYAKSSQVLLPVTVPFFYMAQLTNHALRNATCSIA